MWHLGTWVSAGLASAEGMAGPDPLRDLFQPELFYVFFLFCVHPLEGKPAKNQHPAALLLRLLGIAELGFVPVYLSHLRTGHKVCLQAAPSLERG